MGDRGAGTVSLLFMKPQPRSRLPGATGAGGGVVTVPTGIGSWSQGQGSLVWGVRGVCGSGDRGGRTDRWDTAAAGHTWPACQSTYGVCVCVCFMK